MGLLGAPASPPGVRGDELSDAKARQAQLKKEVAAQKQRVADLNALQGALTAEIKSTASELRGINADLKKVRVKITDMQTKIDAIQADYDQLVVQVKSLDALLVVVQAREVAKKAELAERKALLSERVRSAYDTDRTSLLESFLSGGTFTDLLAEMSYFIDVGEQDKALADQIALDQATLASLHQTTEDTRTRTNELRQETAAQKRVLDASLVALKDAKAELTKLEKRTAATLAAQKRTYQRLARNKAAAAAIIREAAAKQKRLAKTIDKLIEAQVHRGNIPSEFNGTMRWPEDSFSISGDYGCSSFEYYAPGQRLRPLSQRHRPGRAQRRQGSRRRRRDRRLRRVELGRRPGPGLDRDHRPLGERPLVVRPHAADPAGLGRRARLEGRDHRHPGQHGPRHRRAPPLDGRAERRVREPEAVPLGRVRGPRRHDAVTLRSHSGNSPLSRRDLSPC